MWRVDSLEKTLMLGGIGGRRRGDDRGWDGWIASPTRYIWVWVNSGSWWWTGRPGVLRFTGSQRVRQDWETELNWVVKNPPAKPGDIKRCKFNPWVRKIPWKRARHPTPVFLPGEFHGEQNLAGIIIHGVAQSRTQLKWLSSHAWNFNLLVQLTIIYNSLIFFLDT